MKALIIIIGIIMISIYSLKYIIRFVAPFLIRRFFSKYSDSFYEKNAHHFKDRIKKDGIDIDTSKAKTNSGSFSNKGEYVDYEEVNDKK